MMQENKYILCLDTSGEDCQAGIYEKSAESGRLLASAVVRNRRAHSERLLELVDHVLGYADISKNDLSAISVSLGPGSFTGLRIGVSVAKGLGLALGIHVIPVSSHDALSRPFLGMLNSVMVLTIARKGEWYVTKFSSGGRSETGVMTADQWKSVMEPPVILLCDDPDMVKKHLIEEFGKNVWMPGWSACTPDLESLGALACAKWVAGEIAVLDELAPEYVQPFLGKV